MNITALLEAYGWKFWKVCATCSASRKEKWVSAMFPGYVLVLTPSTSNWTLKDKRGRLITRNHYSRFESEMKDQHERVTKAKK